MKKNKVRVISATENISEGSEGILLESVFEGMAEYYSAELAEKVGRGMTENALKCKFNGGTVPIGYTINKDQLFEVDPVKAPYVV
ncbi:MAG: recombinase family protein [Clostridia bacterium]|nr:recombinase family protein [Clostridia bacterium]